MGHGKWATPSACCHTRYDAVGNFLRLIHQATNGNWTRDYTYEEASLIEPGKHSNRLSQTSVGNSDEPYTHDIHGNMTSMPHLSMMQWDLKDQLQASSQQVVNDGGTAETTYYVYDVTGQRVRKVTERAADPGQTPSRMNERIYLGGFERYREHAANGSAVTLERETLHIMDDKQRIALVETTTVDTQSPVLSPQPLIRYQLSNHLGSAAVELDADAAVISYEEYHPYGSTSYQAGRSVAEVSLKRYRYTGKERDEETGLNYHGARYYAPWLGRWTAADPLPLVDGTSHYVYVLNHVTMRVDPSGNLSETPSQVLEHGTKALDLTRQMVDNAVKIAKVEQETEKIRSQLRSLNQRRNNLITAQIEMETAQIVAEGELAKSGVAILAPIKRAGITAVIAAAVIYTKSPALAVLASSLVFGPTSPEEQEALDTAGAVVLDATFQSVLDVWGPKGTGRTYSAKGQITVPPNKTTDSTSTPVPTNVPKVITSLPHEVIPAPQKPASTPTNPRIPEPVGRPIAPGEAKTAYGTHMHDQGPMRRYMERTYPNAQYEVREGLRGPDVIPKSGLNFLFGELKSITENAGSIMRQVNKWMQNSTWQFLKIEPGGGRYFFYDRTSGRIYEGVQDVKRNWKH